MQAVMCSATLKRRWTLKRPWGLRTEADLHAIQLHWQKIQQLLASEEAAVFEPVESEWADSPETWEQNAARYELFRGEITVQHINPGLDTASETSCGSKLTNSDPCQCWSWVPPPPHLQCHERICMITLLQVLHVSPAN